MTNREKEWLCHMQKENGFAILFNQLYNFNMLNMRQLCLIPVENV